MLKRIFKYLTPVCLISLTAVLVYDYFDSFDVPRFRRVDGPFKVPKESITIPTRAGLDTLHISGSKRPSPEGLQAHLKDVNMPVYVFDLQSEDHTISMAPLSPGMDTNGTVKPVQMRMMSVCVIIYAGSSTPENYTTAQKIPKPKNKLWPIWDSHTWLSRFPEARFPQPHRSMTTYAL